MTGLRWLNLKKTGISILSSEIEKLTKLETITASHNNLTSINESITKLNLLRVLSVRHNKIHDKGIPPQLFEKDDLSVLVRS